MQDVTFAEFEDVTSVDNSLLPPTDARRLELASRSRSLRSCSLSFLNLQPYTWDEFPHNQSKPTINAVYVPCIVQFDFSQGSYHRQTTCLFQTMTRTSGLGKFRIKKCFLLFDCSALLLDGFHTLLLAFGSLVLGVQLSQLALQVSFVGHSVSRSRNMLR